MDVIAQAIAKGIEAAGPSIQHATTAYFIVRGLETIIPPITWIISLVMIIKFLRWVVKELQNYD